MTEKELMLSEQLYIANDPELGEDNRKAKRLTHLINTASGEDREQIQVYFRELLEKQEKISGSSRLSIVIMAVTFQ